MAAERSEGRDAAGRFLPGVSGNPKGRPRSPDEVRRQLQAAAPEAVRFLVETMNDSAQKPEMRLKCAEAVLDRLYGKTLPPQEQNGGRVEVIMTDFRGMDE